MRRRQLVKSFSGNPLLVASLAEGSGEPLKTLVQTISRSGASGLDVLLRKKKCRSVTHSKFGEKQVMTYPGALPQAVKAKFIGDLGGVHGVLGM